MSNIEFINMSHPSHGSSSTLQRRAYAHAARQTHLRRANAARKASSQAKGLPSDDREGSDKRAQISERRGQQSSQPGHTDAEHLEAESVQLRSPINALATNRRHHLDCFVKTMSSTENYLLDHCEFWLILHGAAAPAWRNQQVETHTIHSLHQKLYMGPPANFFVMLDVTVIISQLDASCQVLNDQFPYRLDLRTHWVHLAVADQGFLSSIYLSTCRQLYKVYGLEIYADMATYYKVACLRNVSETLSANKVGTDSLIATMISLALDEVRYPYSIRSLKHVHYARILSRTLIGMLFHECSSRLEVSLQPHSTCKGCFSQSVNPAVSSRTLA